MAGNFNQWNPGDPAYQLKSNAEGGWSITLSEKNLPGLLEFKFTRGSWQTVEGDLVGNAIPNRTHGLGKKPETILLNIHSWEDLDKGAGIQGSTRSRQVFLLNSDFYMPQLGQSRRIWMYLPPDYHYSWKRYPVIYAHDGQNLFDNITSFSGEWFLDESLNNLFGKGDPGCIIVGIDNGGPSRLDEYSPWKNPEYGGGQGQAYLDFIVQTLKPYIDQNYRTLSDQAHTGLLGSSMGGLISLYGGLRHQEVFGRIGVFSPSLWFSPEIFPFIRQTGRRADVHFFILGGQSEMKNYDRQLIRLERVLESAGFGRNQVQLRIHRDGRHAEWYWAREFPGFYLQAF